MVSGHRISFECKGHGISTEGIRTGETILNGEKQEDTRTTDFLSD